ncbi:MAG: hypothetical protein ACWA44_05415 [Thiotrichales bacterium]
MPDEAWQRVAAGEALILVDDESLKVGPADASEAIITRGSAEQGWASLKAESLADARALLANYYLSHPLSRSGFDRQAQELLAQHGAIAFAAPPQKLPARTLFVEEGRVIAETAESPRHRYGAYCEVQPGLSAAQIEAAVNQWLEQGEAYERYMSMNVCRYNC